MNTNSMFCWDCNIDINVQAYEKKLFLNAVSSLDIQAHFAGVGLNFQLAVTQMNQAKCCSLFSILRIVLFRFYIKFRVQEFSSWLKQTNHMPAPGGKGQSEKRWEISNKVSTFIAAAAETLAGHVRHSLD